LAMVGTKVKRVKCNTCGTDRVFRGEQPIAESQGFARKRTPKAKKAPGEGSSRSVSSWAARVEAKDPASAKKYNPQTTYAVDDLVDHVTFGLGIVSVVRGDKADIAFKGVEKTLIHAKGAPPPTQAPPPKDKSLKPTSLGIKAPRVSPGPIPEKEKEPAPPAPPADAPA